MRLSRDKIQRMINAGGGSSSGGGGGSDIAGGVTQAWVNQNYVSIEFFRKVFKVWAAGETSSDPDVEIMPNDITTTVKNIQAQAGLWTEAFLSALGQGSGGGTGGATTLDQLDDVVITSPTDGQALIYNATTQMWVNGTIQSGTDMATVWSALAAATNEQINASHLSGVLADYVTATSLQTILGDYLTQTAADQRYITIAYFDRLFRAYNGDTLVSHNDTTSTIDNIKAMFGFWTDLYISALGRNSAATGLGIDNLTDVTINSPTAGQVLQYNATSSKWENATIQTVVALSGLTDVLLTTPTDNQTLLYNSVSGKWYNSDLKTINGQSIIGSGDISVGGGASGNYLPLSGGTLTGQLNINKNVGAGRNNSPLVINGLNPDASWNYFLEMWTPAVTNTHNGFVFGNGFSARNCGHLTFVYKGSGSASNYVAIGMHSVDDSLTVNGWGDVGIGTANASSKLHVENGSITVNNTASTGAIGIAPINVNCTERDSWNFCAKFLSTLSSGNRVGLYTGTSFSARNCGHLTFRSYGSGSTSNYVAIGMHSVDDVLVVCGNGNIGVSTTSPSYKLHVAGTIYATGAITALSDARKKDITGEAGVTVEQIAHAPAVQFLWKDKERRKDGQQVGTLAQYWQTVLPEVVMDKGGELSMQYGVAALVSAIITARKVVDHERRIKQLEQENEELKKQLNAA